jgi:hypothetical protein
MNYYVQYEYENKFVLFILYVYIVNVSYTKNKVKLFLDMFECK